MDAWLYFMNEHGMMPRGITIAAESVKDYACRAGEALRKLASHLQIACRFGSLGAMGFSLGNEIQAPHSSGEDFTQCSSFRAEK